MNKLEVGMYVRTIDGIMKVKNIYQDGRENMDRFENEDGNIYFLNEIIGEPSFNPIDLIEVGDYVNGIKVVEKWEEPFGEFAGQIFIKLEGENEVPTIRKIESVLTKEQFSSMEYRLGDK